MAALLACSVHDVDHPGLTNQYLVNTGILKGVQNNKINVKSISEFPFGTVVLIDL